MRALRLLLSLLAATLAGCVGLALFGFFYLGWMGAPLAVDLAERLLAGQLRVTHAEGGLFGPLELRGIEFESDAVRVELDRLRLDWRPASLRLGELRVTELSLGQARVWLKATPPEPAKPLTPRLPLELRIDQFRLAQLELYPAGAAEGRAPERFSDLHAALDWRQERVRLDHVAFKHPLAGTVSVGGTLRLEPSAIRFERLQLQGPGVLVLHGRLGLLGSPSQLGVGGRELRWPAVGEARLRLPELRAGLGGRLTEGLDARLRLRAQLQAVLEGVEAPLLELQTEAQLGAEMLRLERLRLQGPPNGGQLRGEGWLRWQPVLQAELLVQLDQLDPGLLLPEFPGRLNGELRAQTVGSAEQPRVLFQARLAESRLRDYPLSLEASGSAEQGPEQTAVALERLELRSGSARLQASGALLPQLAAQARLDAPDLRALLPGLTGAAQLQLRLQGAPAHPAVQAQGSASAVAYEGRRLALAELDLDYAPDRVSRGRLRAQGLSQGAQRLAAAELRLDGRTEAHTLSLSARAEQPRAELELRLQGGYDPALRRWQGQLLDSELQPPWGPRWQQEAAVGLSLAADRQSLELACWRLQSHGRACLGLRHQPPLLSLDSRIEAIDSAAFADLLPKGMVLETQLDGAGQIELRDGQPSRLDLRLDTRAGRLQAPQGPELALRPGSLRLSQDGGQLRAQADLRLDHATLAAEAQLPAQGGDWAARGLSGRLQLSVPDLAWIEPLLPGVSELRGRVEGDFSLGGQVGAPLLDGALRLLDGAARVEAAGLQLRELQADLRGGLGAPLKIQASVRSGEGQLQVLGEADLAAGTARIDISGEQLQAANLPDVRLWVSPKLLFEQTAEGMNLSGEVLVPRAEITPRKLGGGVVGASADQVVVGEAPREKSLPLSASVRLRMGEAVRFEGFGLKARFGGQVTVLESPGAGSTRGRGELRLEEARYKAYGQDLALETGRILFDGGPITQPAIDFRAVRRPTDEVSVTLHVRGSLDKPSFELSSSPAMTQQEQLGWLLLGRPIGGEGEFSGSAAALSLALAGGDQVGQRLARGLGIDTFSLGAEPGKDNDQAGLTIGKYLSPRLYVSYTVDLFRQGNTLRMLYDLGKGFKLSTESGEESGGDVLYSRER